ncbi:multiheme c-type cytochrome [Rubinisphaera sp.]|uniref:multiheme c-type cytochrome n=1 Tax=Rubinisphaera sp. TaxID=2024857 RepID=UPI000C0D40DC|nr:multiheme c-type cytochrome [Rubinisphaera sp.]MBV11461.1 hypothetical protein [Rubinisphaera sp.]HCS51360.1 hypothetical protein [Planctomycetaceae bacterium]|tara:strand:- start:15545 stop:17119 length:1575 start_codon:yes stop_codon:yes gene_type:complete
MLKHQASRLTSNWLLLLLLAPIVAIGCGLGGSSDSPPAEETKGNTTAPSKVSDSPKEIVAGWKDPQFALVLTGEQKGYMEPCGCSETQSGGISRRADLFRQLREDKGWEVAGLDLGDFVKRSRRQDQIKFGVMHTALKDMGYEALTLGPADLKLQVDYLFSTMSNADDLPYVSANVIFYDTPDIGSPARFQIFELNGVKIGVTGVLGEKFASKVFPEGDNSANDLLRVDDPVKSLKPIVAKLKEQGCDILFLLSQASKSETESILKSVPEFDLCLTGGGPEDPNGLTETVGKTVVMEAGRKGKYAGVLGYYPDEEKKFRYELVDLNKDRFKRTQAMEEHMAFYQDLLREQNIVESEPAVPHPSGYTYVGSEKCGTCHTKAYAKWKSTKHSHATETLIKGEENYSETEWISRINDPECLACHAVGWNPQEVFRFEGGFVNMEDTPHLTGQGCENCHGPGSHHTEMEAVFTETRQSTPDIVAAREAIKVNLVMAEKQVCVKCHDFENSPKFNFEKYWDKVIHRGKD